MNKDYKSLKDRVNELLVENKDLKEEVGKLRYLKHPANTDQQEITTASIDTVNALTSENPNRKDERAKLSDSENQLNEDNDDISATEMKNQVNLLTNENQDLKSMIGKLRYGQVVITNQEDTKQKAINTAEQKQVRCRSLFRNISKSVSIKPRSCLCKTQCVHKIVRYKHAMGYPQTTSIIEKSP